MTDDEQQPPRVRLETAWRWTCPTCGHKSYANAIAVPMSAEEREEALRSTMDLEPYESIPDDADGEFVTQPEKVVCGKCRSIFETEVDEE